MAIKYDVHTLDNVFGSGKQMNVVSLWTQPAMSDKSLTDAIEKTCTLNRADVLAVFSVLREFTVRELSQGRKFHIPGLGYFSLSAGVLPPDKLPYGKITGKDIRLHGIRFQPERATFKEIGRQVSFERMKGTTASKRYSKEELAARLADYFKSNRYLTCRSMRSSFALSDYMARKWLARLTAEGVLVKEGSARNPIYFPATTE